MQEERPPRTLEEKENHAGREASQDLRKGEKVKRRLRTLGEEREDYAQSSPLFSSLGWEALWAAFSLPFFSRFTVGGQFLPLSQHPFHCWPTPFLSPKPRINKTAKRH